MRAPLRHAPTAGGSATSRTSAVWRSGTVPSSRPPRSCRLLVATARSLRIQRQRAVRAQRARDRSRLQATGAMQRRQEGVHPARARELPEPGTLPARAVSRTARSAARAAIRPTRASGPNAVTAAGTIVAVATAGTAAARLQTRSASTADVLGTAYATARFPKRALQPLVAAEVAAAAEEAPPRRIAPDGAPLQLLQRSAALSRR